MNMYYCIFHFSLGWYTILLVYFYALNRATSKNRYFTCFYVFYSDCVFLPCINKFIMIIIYYYVTSRYTCITIDERNLIKISTGAP